ncbi:MAG: cytochrome c [Acidobacteria bacterium]|nr:cytochrome c [Acidobacteriota bacterium]
MKVFSFLKWTPFVLLLSLAPFRLLTASAQSTEGEPILTEKQLKGKNIFMQRCSLCHLPKVLKQTYQPVGPILERLEDDPAAEEAAREFILKGSANMPGFQYTLDRSEVDALIAYLEGLR